MCVEIYSRIRIFCIAKFAHFFLKGFDNFVWIEDIDFERLYIIINIILINFSM